MPAEEGKPPATAKRSAGKNVLFSLVTFALLVVVLHVVSYIGIRYQNRQALRQIGERLRPIMPRYLDYLNLRLEFVHPFLKMTLAPDQNLPFCRINHQGYRGPDFVREKTGAFRVAIIGGSAAMGWFANSEEDTLHSRLKAELETAFPSERFEVYNFGVFQYNSTQELFVLETEALNYAPDFVIVLSGINDFGWALIEKPWRPRYPLGWIHMQTIIAPDYFQAGWARKPWLLRNSYKWSFLAGTAWENFKVRCSPARFLGNLFRPAKTDHFFLYGETEFALIGERTGLWAQNVELMARLLDSYGIPYCASLQPCAFLHHVATESELRSTMMFVRGEKDQDTMRRYWAAAYAAAEQALGSRPFPIKTLELSRCFENSREAAYFDLIHFNARGAELLARRYAEHLRPVVEKWQSAKSPLSPTPPKS